MLHIAIKPADKLIKGYYDVLGGLGQLNFDHEGAVRTGGWPSLSLRHYS